MLEFLGYVIKGIDDSIFISWITFSGSNQPPCNEDTQLAFGKAIMERN